MSVYDSPRLAARLNLRTFVATFIAEIIDIVFVTPCYIPTRTC